MKKTEFLKLIDPITDKLYSFAFAMVPDELQASQIVVDAFNVFFLREKDFLESVDEDFMEKRVVIQFQKEIIKGIFESIYKLGIRRFAQLYSLKERLKDSSAFYRELDAQTRAILYLKEKMKMNYKEIKLITNLDRHVIIEKVYSARHTLVHLYDQENPMELANAAVEEIQEVAHG
jgi:hypothetical protein